MCGLFMLISWLRPSSTSQLGEWLNVVINLYNTYDVLSPLLLVLLRRLHKLTYVQYKLAKTTPYWLKEIVAQYYYLDTVRLY